MSQLSPEALSVAPAGLGTVNRTARWLLALTALFAFGITAMVSPKLRPAALKGGSRPYKVAAGARVSPLARALRPNYPYSVIPGGVYNPDELRMAMQSDPVLRDHYAGFDTSKARLVRLTEDRYSYVSYRQNGRIYWTRKKLKIAAGEVLLTDGVRYIKTRCGNRLSDLPVQPTQRLNEAEAQLSPAPLTENSLAGLTFVPSPGGSTANTAGSDATGIGPVSIAPASVLGSVPEATGNARSVSGLPEEVAWPLIANEPPGGASSGDSWGSPWGGGSTKAGNLQGVGGSAGLLPTGTLAQVAPVPEPAGIFFLSAACLIFLGGAAHWRKARERRPIKGENRFRQ